MTSRQADDNRELRMGGLKQPPAALGELRIHSHRPRQPNTITRLLLILSPSAAAIILRLSQLLLLVAVSRISADVERPSSIAAFAIVSSFAVFADAGAANYVLTRIHLSRGQLVRALWVQGGISSAGAAASICFALLVLPWSDPLAGFLLVSALAVSQAIDSATRAARSAKLQSGHDLAFGLGDFFLAVAKSGLAVLALMTDSAAYITALPAASAIVFGYFATSSIRNAHAADKADPPWQILKFGVSGAVSGAYSQAPFLLVAALAPVDSVAVVAIALRIVQPLEILPAVASQQVLPRVRRNSLRAPRFWAASFGTGFLLACILVGCGPRIEALFDVQFTPSWVFALVAATLPFKYGNYMLSSFLLALGGVNAKTLLSLAVGVLAILVSLCSVTALATVAAPVAMLLSECVLATGLALLIRTFRASSRNGTI